MDGGLRKTWGLSADVSIALLTLDVTSFDLQSSDPSVVPVDCAGRAADMGGYDSSEQR
jgi:hypothetical protein